MSDNQTADDNEVGAGDARFYRSLVELIVHTDTESFLDDAVRVITEVTGAELGYLELHDPERFGRLAKGHRCGDNDVARIRSSISGGIIGEALKANRPISTTSAETDERFADLDSVKQNQIKAVLCAPIGVDPSIGVLYLQGRNEPGAFGHRDNDRVDAFAKVVAPLATRIVRRHRTHEVLMKHNWNVAAAARELRISRQHLYDRITEFKLRTSGS